MNFTPEEIKHLREIAAKATKRPWKLITYTDHKPKTGDWAGAIIADGENVYSGAFSFHALPKLANAEFITSAVNTHEDALTVIEQQRAEIARLTNEVKAHVAVIHRLHAYAVTDHEIVWKDIEVMLDEERIESGAG